MQIQFSALDSSRALVLTSNGPKAGTLGASRGISWKAEHKDASPDTYSPAAGWREL